MRLGSLLLLCCSLLGLYAVASISNDEAPPTSTPTTHYCATDVLLNDRLINDETFRAQHEQLEQAAYDAMKQGQAKNNAPPYVLPIVFHIIHEGGIENISDGLVQQALDHLNQSFANTDYYDQGTGVATEIQFCLAKRNPEGNASSGVERVESPLTNLNMDAQDEEMKDLSRYDPTQYINVWIVKEICSGVSGCGVAGYAYFPSSHGQPHDGIVVEAKWLGTSPGNSSVLTHEIGHYLGLYHTFEGACQNDNCLTDGDRVCDTPPDQSTAAVPCNASVNSCTTDTNSGFTTDQDDLFINYMDYGDWDCYSAFTAGQRDRMHFFIEGARFSLLESDGCLDPCTMPIEVSLNSPMDSVEIGQNITYTATGTNADNFTWFVDGVEVGTGPSLTYSFVAIGFYTVEVQAGNTDPNCSASATVTTTAFCPVQSSFSPSSFQVTPGTVVLFTNNSTNATDYEWSVDGNSEGTGTGFFYLFDNMGTYVVTLAASNSACTDDFSVVITVSSEGSANTGLPIWPMQGGADGGFHTLDWRADPPFNTTLTQISDEANGSTGGAFNSCGDVVFFAVHSALNTPEQLFLYAPDGTPLLTTNTANGPGLNAVRGPTELQVVPVPGTQTEWYLIYREYSSDSGAPINNAAYKTLPLEYSRVRLELDGSITVVDRDLPLPDGQGSSRNYSDGIAVSRTANGDPTRHYLYAARRNVNQNSLSLDRFIIDGNGITWDANTGDVPASYWNLTHAGSEVELSPTEDRIVVCNRNQWSNYQDYIIFDAQAFSNTAAQAIILDNLMLVPDGEPQDESNVLPVPLSIDQLSFNNTYPLQFMRNMPHKMSRMEFSPNGRFLYTTGGGFQSGSSQQTTLSYLAQIDLESNPLQVRFQIETTPTPYNPSTGLACPISQCGDDWHALGVIESSYNGNLYFTKRNDQTLYVIPDPNQFMPQKLLPGIIDLSTAEEPNLNLIGNPSNFPDAIDGFSYLSTASQNVQLVVTGLDCAGECRAPFDVVLISSDSSLVETYTIANCPDTLFVCADTSLSYRLVDLVLAMEFPNVIQNGEVIYPAGATTFAFSEPLGCPEDCDEPFVYFYGDGDLDLGSATLLSDDEYLYIGGSRDGDGLIMKLTTAGEVIWSQVLSPYADPTFITDLKIDNDQALIGCGYSQVGADQQAFAFKMDPVSGAITWTQTYAGGTNSTFFASDIFEGGANNSYILLGGTNGNAAPGLGCDAAFYTLDRNTGNLSGARKHFNLGSCEGFASTVFVNGQFYATGRFNFAGGGVNRMRPAIMGIDMAGNPIWSRLYLVDINQDARLYSTDIIRDGGNFVIFVHGDDNGTAGSTTNTWLIRTNGAGGAQWVRQYTFPEPVGSREIISVGNGYVLLVKGTQSETLYTLRTNGAGEVLWARQLSDIRLDRNGDEMVLIGNHLYLTATSSLSADGVDKVALFRMDVETGELPEGCVDNVPIEAVFTNSPYNYDGFNAMTVYDSPFTDTGEFPVQSATIQALPESCGPACGPEICDNEIDDDGDGFVDCDDPDLSNDCCCYTPPVLDLGPDTILCDNAVVQLDAGPGFASYEWWDGSTEQTYTAFTAGNYYVMVTDSCGNTQSDTLSVTIDPATAIDLGPDTLICVGASLSLSVTGFDTYQWFPPELVDCATCPTVTVNAGEGTYTLAVVGSTDQGCISADSLTITVQGNGVGAFNTTNLCAGDSLTFGDQLITAAGEYYDTSGTVPCLTIDTLQVNILPTINTQDSFLICDGHIVPIFGEEIGEAGVYQATFTAQNGCDSTHTITLEVLENLNTDETMDLCDGDVIELFGEEVDSPGEYTGLFQAANGCDSVHTVLVNLLSVVNTEESISICEGETVVIFGDVVDEAGEYSQTTPGSNGCDSTHVVTLTVLPTTATNETLSICAGESTAIFGDLVTEAGTYSASFTGTNGCDSTHTIELSVLPLLETSEAIAICEGESIELFGEEVSTAGQYTGLFTAVNGCDSTHTAELSILPLLESSETIAICEGESIELFGEEVSTAGQYTGIFTAVNGCDSTHQVDVTVLPNLATSESINLCEGSTIELFGETISTAGTYEATFTAVNGCDSTHTVSVTIQPQAMTSETISGLCPGEVLEVFGQEVVAPGTFSEVYIAANGCDSTHTVVVQYESKNINLDVFVICEGETVDVFGQETSTPGLYTQTYTGANGCDSLVQIQVIQEIFLGEVVISPPLPGQESYAATILAAGGGWPYTYEWSVTDETTETIFNVPLGEHSITVTSVHGCEYVLDFMVDDFLDIFSEPTVGSNDPFYIPNAFSPNYDGYNDYFTIFASDKVKSIRSLMVFSRWGETIFERQDFVPNRIQLGWDGRFRNQPMGAGAYIYKAEIELDNGEIVQRAGDLILMR